MRHFLFCIFFILLPIISAAGQTQQENFISIENDTASFFYKFNLPDSTSYDKNDSKFNFGISRLITPRDTIDCYLSLYVDPFKGYKGYGSAHLEAEDHELILFSDSLWKRSIFHGFTVIRKFKECIRFKVKAYSTYGDNTSPKKKWYTKCLKADVVYYPYEKSRSTVTYSVKYKKYRPWKKYGVMRLDSASIAKRDKKNKAKNLKMIKWQEKQYQKSRKEYLQNLYGKKGKKLPNKHLLRKIHAK